MPVVVPIDAEILDRARVLLDQHGLLMARDALHAAVVLEHEMGGLCSFDSAFTDLLDQAVLRPRRSGFEQRVNLLLYSWNLSQPDVRFRLRSGEVDPMVVRRHLEPAADGARDRQQLVSFAGRAVEEE